MTAETITLQTGTVSRLIRLKHDWETMDEFLERVLNGYEGRCSRCGECHSVHVGCAVREAQGR